MRYLSAVLGEEITINSITGTNAKLEKKVGDLLVRIYGISLSPANSSGIANLCGAKSDGCEASCVLVTAGRAAMPNTQRAARNRTALFFDNRELFWGLVEIELGKHLIESQFAGAELGFRANVAQDNLLIETMRPNLLSYGRYNYDYTAIYQRALRSLSWAHNYQLTFSVKETTPVERVETILASGGNVAIVVDSVYNPQHKKYGVLPNVVTIGNREYKTVDGDVHDLRRREIDGSGVVVLLRAKGHNKAKEHARRLGFAKSLGEHGRQIDKQLTIGGYGVRLEF